MRKNKKIQQLDHQKKFKIKKAIFSSKIISEISEQIFSLIFLPILNKKWLEKRVKIGKLSKK